MNKFFLVLMAIVLSSCMQIPVIPSTEVEFFNAEVNGPQGRDIGIIVLIRFDEKQLRGCSSFNEVLLRADFFNNGIKSHTELYPVDFLNGDKLIDPSEVLQWSIFDDPGFISFISVSEESKTNENKIFNAFTSSFEKLELITLFGKRGNDFKLKCMSEKYVSDMSVLKNKRNDPTEVKISHEFTSSPLGLSSTIVFDSSH